jgi:HAMP domain-containing protein
MTTAATPAQVESAKQRRWRNFLIDARFQLKFASYIVALTLVVAGLLGVFLWRTTAQLFKEVEVAVEARSKVAETSRELSMATLSNEVMQHMDDPIFEKQLKDKSDEIDRLYDIEKRQIIEARGQLVARQQVTMWALIGGLFTFVMFIGMATIVTTHRIVGPLFRVKKMAQEVTAGKLHPPTYGLRPSDELKDVFEAFATMVRTLRSREEDDLRHVETAIHLAERSHADHLLVDELKRLQGRLKAKLE